MSRPVRRRPGRPLILAAAVFALLVVRVWQWSARPAPPERLDEGVYQVERVVDGDTLLLTNQARIRLKGIDTPETVKPDHPVERWGPEATEFARQFVSGGEIRLQFDRERKDKYDRFLAYVWVEDQLLNEALVRAGLARAVILFPISPAMKRRLLAAQEEARAARRAIWSEPFEP